MYDAEFATRAGNFVLIITKTNSACIDAANFGDKSSAAITYRQNRADFSPTRTV